MKEEIKKYWTGYLEYCAEYWESTGTGLSESEKSKALESTDPTNPLHLAGAAAIALDNIFLQLVSLVVVGGSAYLMTTTFAGYADLNLFRFVFGAVGLVCGVLFGLSILFALYLLIPAIVGSIIVSAMLFVTLVLPFILFKDLIIWLFKGIFW